MLTVSLSRVSLLALWITYVTTNQGCNDFNIAYKYLKKIIISYWGISSRISTLNGKEHPNNRKTLGTIYRIMYYKYVEVKWFNGRNSIPLCLLMKNS